MDIKLAHLIISTVREAVLTTHRVDSCVASTRLLRDVLKLGFDIELEPRAVTTLVYNPYITERINSGELSHPDRLIEAMWDRESGGWSVGIGFGAEAAVDDTKWAGHLVGVSKHADGRLLLWDPSLDQAARPTRNMHLKPLVRSISRDPYGTEPVVVMEAECAVIYRSNQEQEHIVQLSPDWTDSSRFTTNLAYALRRLAEQGAPVGDYYER
jgi:WD40 repeat protein